MKPASTFLAAVFLCLMAVPQLWAQTPTCPELLEKPIYHPLARMAGIEGVVKVRFSIGADGKAFNVVSEGRPLLIESVEPGIIRTQIGDSHCEASYDLEYKFALNPEVNSDPMLSVTFTAPNQFLITANLPKVICTYSLELREPWYRRVFKKPRTVLADTPCTLIRTPPQ